MTFLIIIFLLFIIGPYLIRLLMPILLRSFIKKAQNQMNNPYQQETPRKEGEVNINTPHKKTKTSDEKNQLGDYVDYEEIKEE